MRQQDHMLEFTLEVTTLNFQTLLMILKQKHLKRELILAWGLKYSAD